MNESVLVNNRKHRYHLLQATVFQICLNFTCILYKRTKEPIKAAICMGDHYKVVGIGWLT